MKKIIRILSMALTVIMLMSLLIACNNTSTDEGSKESEQPSDTLDSQEISSEPTFKINGVDITEYTVVYNKETNSASKKVLNYFNNKLNSEYTIELKATIANSSEYQIFIGVEGHNSAIDEFFSTCEAGMIGFDGKNIYLLAKDDVGLYSVADAFLAKATADGVGTVINVSENEKVEYTMESLTVMSYNVLYDMYYDDSKDNSRDITALADFIKDQGADVFGTQETLKVHKNEILKAMPNYDCYEGIKLAGGAEMSNMIFWNADKYKAVSKGFQYLSATPYIESKIDESNSYRGFSYVVLESLATKKQFLFVDVHLTYRDSDNNNSGSKVETARFKQAQYLVKFLESEKFKDMPIILVGDFNSVPNSKALNVIENADRMDRALTVAATKGDTGSTLAKNSHTERVSKYIFDHIFVTSDRIATDYFTTVDVKINDSGAQRYPSDHLPILAKITIC